MTKREALRDLQNRLAGRLQAARSDPASAAWLGVLVGRAHYLLPLTQAGEIFPMTSVTHVPYAVPWFAGVVNLRGGLYGVVDLADFLGVGVVRTEQSWTDVRLITFNTELEINCALMVDGLVGLRRTEAFVKVTPAVSGSPVWLGMRHEDAQGLVWQELDLRALSQTVDFLNIGN
jgi:twitching motility protein PilI